MTERAKWKQADLVRGLKAVLAAGETVHSLVIRKDGSFAIVIGDRGPDGKIIPRCDPLSD